MSSGPPRLTRFRGVRVRTSALTRPDGAQLYSLRIHFIIPDGPETVWIGAHKRGLYRWRGGRVSRLPEGAGLPSEDVRTIAPGDFDDLWIGTAEGLFQVSRAGLDAVLDGRPSS